MKSFVDCPMRLLIALYLHAFFRFEKLVGGLYQAEIVRQILYELTRRGLLFGGFWPEKWEEYKSIHPSFLCMIERDPPYLFYTTEFLLREHYEIKHLCADDVRIVRYVCQAVVFRAACLTASGNIQLLFQLLVNRVN